MLFELETALSKFGLLPKTTGAEGQALRASWDSYRRKLRELAVRGGALRVRNHVVEPLVERLGYARLAPADQVGTREGAERGGDLIVTADGGAQLRIWCTDLDEDLAAPARRGAAWRYSHLRIAQRVLLASGERVGLLTNGTELHLLVCDPARPDSEIVIAIDPSWKMSREVPDSYRLVLALGSPAGVRAIPDLIDKARLQQARVTKELRRQARQAVERFVQEVLDHPENHGALGEHTDRARLARDLWREGLITVYRVLFVLKLESSDDPARAFSFASTSLWRSTFSPSVALAKPTRAVLDAGAETGHWLEEGLRALFRMFAEGLQCTELNVQPLGGALFGPEATPILSRLWWGEHAVANLLDRLLWTETKTGRERVHYGPLDVEDLGRVYEALLELEPGIASEPMSRLRRQKLEVVVPLAQGEKYRAVSAASEIDDDDSVQDADDDDDAAHATGRKTRVEWIEEIHPGQFYLRVGLGRKATGSYYTPHPFVRFLVQETLGQQIAERSPQADPRPAAILGLKVLDPAMGSGHFLVEACRFLARALYEACRLCDDRVLAAERRAEEARTTAEREAAFAEAVEHRQRLAALPDPDQELVRYLPSRAPEGQESGLSQRKAEALCRRLVAVHCLYGVDKNPLAVELAKLALWIESHAEGLPLTFLDHRLVLGDSLTGPFFEHLLMYPGSRTLMDDLFTHGLRQRFTGALGEALKHVHDIEASAGVMLGPAACDDGAYARLVRSVGDTGGLLADFAGEPRLRAMIGRGLGVEAVPTAAGDLIAFFVRNRTASALPYDLAFAEIFSPLGMVAERRGFDTVVGNPPWDAIQFKSKEFFASFDFEILNAPTKRERSEIERRLLADTRCRDLFDNHVQLFEQQKRANDAIYKYQKVEVEGDLAGRQVDSFRVFMERNASLLGPTGLTGVVVPSAFHANEGATGIRRLYLEQMALRCCYSFENRRKLFEIDSRFKFALVVASQGGPANQFSCGFYLHDDEWLFQPDEILSLSLDLVRAFDPAYLTLPEFTDQEAVPIFRCMYERAIRVKDFFAEMGLELKRELTDRDSEHVVLDGPLVPRSWSEVDAEGGDVSRAIPVIKGEDIFQFTDRYTKRPYGAVATSKVAHVLARQQGMGYFRMLLRKIASSTNERTVVAAAIPPGLMCHESIQVDVTPNRRPYAWSLAWLAVANSYSFDWAARQLVGANLNLFIIERLPFVCRSDERAFLVHGALRLVASHEGFERLWREELGVAWRERREPFSWPVLAGDEERWQIRASMDAVVADAYGLSREQYARVLSAFSHDSYRRAPELCLARFDELRAVGLRGFTAKYDPYWDIPLNENLPQPVIDIPLPEDAAAVREQGVLYAEAGDVGEARRAAERQASYGRTVQGQPGAKRRPGRRGPGGRS